MSKQNLMKHDLKCCVSFPALVKFIGTDEAPGRVRANGVIGLGKVEICSYKYCHNTIRFSQVLLKVSSASCPSLSSHYVIQSNCFYDFCSDKSNCNKTTIQVVAAPIMDVMMEWLTSKNPLPFSGSAVFSIATTSLRRICFNDHFYRVRC